MTSCVPCADAYTVNQASSVELGSSCLAGNDGPRPLSVLGTAALRRRSDPRECDRPSAILSGYPIEKLTDALPGLASAPLIGTAFVPPVSAEAVARAAVQVSPHCL